MSPTSPTPTKPQPPKAPEPPFEIDLPQAIRSMLEMTEASVKAAQEAVRSSQGATAALPEIRSLLKRIRPRSYVRRLALELLIVLLLAMAIYFKPGLFMSSEDRRDLELGRLLSARWTALAPEEQERLMALLDSTPKPDATSASKPN